MIQAAGPVGAATIGAFVGVVAAVAVGHPAAAVNALLPLGATLLAVLLRPSWAAVPALGAATAAAAVASAAVALSPSAGSGTTLVAVTHDHSGIHAAQAAGQQPWQHPWLPTAVALAVLVAAQVAIRRRNGRSPR